MNKHYASGVKLYKGLTIIIPALNEESNLIHTVEEVYEYCSKFKLCNFNFEIILINDGSKDKTPAIVDAFCRKHPREVVAIHNPKNKGYGYSIVKGIEKSRYDLVFFTDADRQFKIQNLDLLLPLMFTGIPDIVVGYRLNRQDSFLRKFNSWGFNSLVKFIFDIGVKDIDCAFKIFKKSIFEQIKIESKNFFINTEILAKAVFFNLRILEIAVEHFPRQAGRSTVSLKYIPITLIELFKIWIRVRKLKPEIKL